MTTAPSLAPLPFSPRPSFRRPLLFLGLAVLWSGFALSVLLNYHIPEPLGVLGVTINGHTYVGHPPALTIYERDPVSFVTIVAVLGSGLLTGALDLGLRFVQRSTRSGTSAVVAGAAVILVSLLGLLPGLAGVGVVGALLIISGLPSKKRVAQ
jgi:hypothetical protein